MVGRASTGRKWIFGAAAAACAAAAPVAPSTQCVNGAYGSGDKLLVITRPSVGGVRATFLDGRIFAPGGKGARVECSDGAVLVRREDGRTERWPQVPLKMTPTSFKSAGVTLKGMLIEPPAGRAKPPLMVIAHGSESFPALPAAQAAPLFHAARGVSVFIFDKHGTGQSGGRFHMNFRRLADDLVAASAEARRLARGRYSRFGLDGSSQGGWTVPLAAKRAGAEFMIINYGGIFTYQEEDAEQVADELRIAGYGPDVLKKARQVTDATGRVAASGYREGFTELARVKAAYSHEPWFSRIRGEFSGDILRSSEADLRRARNSLDIDHRHDSLAVLRALNVPTLWILAEGDREAPVRLTQERLKLLVSEGKPIQVVVFPDTDHGMEEYNQKPDGSREYTRITDGDYRLGSDWARQRLSPPYGRARFWPAPGKR